MSLPERPPFGTAPIRCGKTKCSWHYGRAIEAAHGIGITAAQKETP